MKYTKENIAIQIQTIYQEIGDLLTRDWWEQNYKSRHLTCSNTIQRYFGSWNKALEFSIGKTLRNTPLPLIDCQCKHCGTSIRKRQGEVRKSKKGNSFCNSSCAAKYNNTHKTIGTRRSKLECWIEQSLSEIYPDLNILYNNRGAINSELDIYIPSLQLAFELNGIFHYEPIYGDSKLQQIQSNDNNKFMKCQNAGISLCILDVSSINHFKPKFGQKYLDIIVNIINEQIRVAGTAPASIC